MTTPEIDPKDDDIVEFPLKFPPKEDDEEVLPTEEVEEDSDSDEDEDDDSDDDSDDDDDDESEDDEDDVAEEEPAKDELPFDDTVL